MINWVIKGILILLVMGILPILVGDIIARWTKTGEHTKLDQIVFRYVIGNITMWAVFLVVADPLILKKQPFMTAVYVWTAIMATLVLCDVVCLIMKAVRKQKNNQGEPLQEKTSCDSQIKQYLSDKNNIFTIVVAVLAIGVILFQCYQYVAYMHLDEDDSRFVVNACEAYDHNTMLLVNPATGETMETWTGSELAKDVASPWMIYVAVLSKLVQIYPTIVAHTILPVFLLLMAYGAYWLIGRRLFANKDMQSSWIFLFFCALIHMFFNASVYTQSTFMLTRIWQGKATFAAITIPLIFYLLLSIHQHSRVNGKYILLALINLSACLLSGFGIFLAPVLTAIVGIWFLLIKRRWPRILCILISCVPNVLMALLYVNLK